MRTHTTLLRSLAWLATASAVVALGACQDEALNPPPAGPTTDTMFTSYVAFGNSITAGYQSGGINDSTQKEGYAYLLAQQMGTTFHLPLLTSPGCPPPIVNVFTQERLAGGSGGDCYARTPGSVSAVINNVAVPGAAVVDLFNNFDSTSAWGSSPNPLTTFILGGRTQVQAAADADPTFVTVWIGNNDVLGSVLNSTNPGDSNLVTPPDTFAARYNQLMSDLDAISYEPLSGGSGASGKIMGGVLIGVVQVAVAPYLTQGRAWKGFEAQFDAQTSPLNALDVSNNCLAHQALGGPDTAWVEVPFPVGGAVLASAQAKIDSVQGGTLNPGSLQPAVLDCGGASVVSVPEVIHIISAVTQYNATIAAAAAARGWGYLDPTPLLAQLAVDPTVIRPFPAFYPSDPQHVTAPFGSALSRDGIHPSAASHKLVANALIQLINQKYGTNLQPVP